MKHVELGMGYFMQPSTLGKVEFLINMLKQNEYSPHTLDFVVKKIDEEFKLNPPRSVYAAQTIANEVSL